MVRILCERSLLSSALFVSLTFFSASFGSTEPWQQMAATAPDIDKLQRRFPFAYYMHLHPDAAKRVDTEFVDNTEEICAEDPYFKTLLTLYALVEVWGK